MFGRETLKLLVFLFLILSGVSFGAIFFISVISFLFLNEGEESTKEIFSYQFLEVDPSKRTSSVGFVTSFENLSEKDYLFYETIESNLIVISNFGSTEYICHGSCFCSIEEGGGRRTTTTTASKVASSGFYYLLVAVGSIMAYDIAEKYFSEECVKTMESCPKQSVESVVDSCSSVATLMEHPDEDDEEESPDFIRPEYYRVVDGEVEIFDDLGEKHDEEGKIRKFLCKGGCLPKLYTSHDENEMVKDFDCGHLELEGEITIDTSGVMDSFLEIYANARWREDHMIGYCQKKSSHKYEYRSPHSGQTWTRLIQFCMGSAGGENRTIKCKEIKS